MAKPQQKNTENQILLLIYVCVLARNHCCIICFNRVVMIHNIHRGSTASSAIVPRGLTHIFRAMSLSHTHTDLQTHCFCCVLSGASVRGCFFFVCISVAEMQIVLSPVDPSQSERSCLNVSAFDWRGPLIHPDSPPRELMGGETAHSTHVTQRSDRRWGAAVLQTGGGERTVETVHAAAAVTTLNE